MALQDLEYNKHGVRFDMCFRFHNWGSLKTYLDGFMPVLIICVEGDR